MADFGLSENTYAKNYIRKKQTSGVKLPIKWMAYESLIDGIFSEKTDVVSSISCTQNLFRSCTEVWKINQLCIPVYINIGFGMILSRACNLSILYNILLVTLFFSGHLE